MVCPKGVGGSGCLSTHLSCGTTARSIAQWQLCLLISYNLLGSKIRSLDSILSSLLGQNSLCQPRTHLRGMWSMFLGNFCVCTLRVIGLAPPSFKSWTHHWTKSICFFPGKETTFVVYNLEKLLSTTPVHDRHAAENLR